MTRNAALLCACLLAACTADAPPPAAAGAQFDATRLPTSHWTLAEATAADGSRIDALFVRDGHPLRLDFAGGRLSVANACNRIGGPFEVDGDRISIGGLAMTEMACADPALMRLDHEIASRLQAGGTLRYADDGSLVYTTAAGDILRFSAVPTAGTEYGGPGTQVFLEVAPQRVECHHPLMPEHRCLQVRGIGYDDRGLKVSEGGWRPLHQEIEGYTHEPGVRNVLRLKRFDVEDPPADGSSVAYVLDMVVESEIVAR